MENYLAFFHFTRTEALGVTFPQFPGCVSMGHDFADAQRMAAEALSLHVDGMREDGETIPPPVQHMSQSMLTSIYEAARQDEDGPVLPISIPLLPVPGNTARIQVTIDDRLLKRIDAVTKNRSAFLADAAVSILGPG